MILYPSSPMYGYPVVRGLEFETRISVGRDGTEQRSGIHSGRESWTLNYSRLTLAERDTLVATFVAAKGAFDQTIRFAFGGVNYDGFYFESDLLEAVEQEPERRSLAVTLRQVKRAIDVGAPAASFPVLSTGRRVQLPHRYGKKFDTTAVQTEGGRYARYNRATAPRAWSAGGTVLTDSEADAIWDLFRLCRGQLQTFSFTEPDAEEVVPVCRFNADRIERRYVAPGVNSVQVGVVEVL